MLTPDVIRELNLFRDTRPGTSACPAPVINLHFSQMGVVTACCFNRQHVLGVYPENTVQEIWNGKPIQEIREALDRYDLTKGCEKCHQQIAARDFGGSHAVFYSNYARFTAEKRRKLGLEPPGTAPMPMRLEFNIHNSCNLQCVMCHGLASSAIRTRREGLAAMPNPYDEAFVDQLEPYFPYVVETDFMGGEPFLIPVYIMLWERIARTNPQMQVCILTNGTILNDRIKGLLEKINCWIHVSIDSVFKHTYEAIRKGASYEEVMAHCDYYVELMRQRDLNVIFRFCPMRQNWREIPDTVAFCNAKGVMLMYNQVDSPISFSLHTLPQSELQSVVSYLEDRVPPTAEAGVLKHNHEHYLDLIQRLRGFLDRKNRLNGLQTRLSVSAAVVGQYTKKQEATAKRLVLSDLESLTSTLIETAKRYLITRLNVDQAEETDGDLPAEITDTVAARLSELKEFLDHLDQKAFLKIYLNELIRTYSGVWGVRQPHDFEIYGRVDQLSAAVAAHPDKDRLITDLLTAAPGEVYHALASRSPEGVINLYTRGPASHAIAT